MGVIYDESGQGSGMSENPAPEQQMEGPVEPIWAATSLYDLIMMAKTDGVSSVTDPEWVQKDFTATDTYKNLYAALTAPPPVQGMGSTAPSLPSFFEMPTDIQRAASSAAVDLPFAIFGEEFRAVEYALAKAILEERLREGQP